MKKKTLRACKSGLAMVVALQASAAFAGPVSETVYFTTYDGGSPDVWSTTMTYTGNGNAGSGTFSPGTPTALASTPGADGIVMNPNNGQLLVGGQGTGNIYEVPKGGGSYTTLPAGMTTYEITVDPSGKVVWGGGSEGGARTITEVPLTGGAPTVIAVSGSSASVTHITFAPGQAAGTAYYTSGGDDGFGDFGTINLATGKTTAIMTGVQAAHGMVYDPFSNSLIISGGNELEQYSLTSDKVVSTAFFGSDVLDQGAVDGNGHLYWADNDGNLVFIDYSNTGLIGSASDFTSNNFLMSDLDDLAPLIGTGGTSGGGVPEPATLSLVGLCLVALALTSARRVRS
jgi:hypothetical protein